MALKDKAKKLNEDQIEKVTGGSEDSFADIVASQGLSEKQVTELYKGMDMINSLHPDLNNNSKNK